MDVRLFVRLISRAKPAQLRAHPPRPPMLAAQLAEATARAEEANRQLREASEAVASLVASLEQARAALSHAKAAKAAAQAEASRLALQLEQEERDEPCTVCGDRDDAESMLLCDMCDGAYHIFCLEPPLRSIPQGEWFCAECEAVRKKYLHTRLKVFWRAEKQWFAGVVRDARYEDKRLICHVFYDAGDDFWHCLEDEQWRPLAPRQEGSAGPSSAGSAPEPAPSEAAAPPPAPQSKRTALTALAKAPTVPRKAAKKDYSAQVIQKMTQALLGETTAHLASGTRDALISLDDSEEEEDLPSTSAALHPAFARATHCAKAIHEALLQKVGGVVDKEYFSRSRKLLFNLKQNADLRASVMNGEFTPAQLVIADHNSLASKEMQMKRREWQERALKKVVVDEDADDDYIDCPGLGKLAKEELRAARER